MTVVAVEESRGRRSRRGRRGDAPARPGATSGVTETPRRSERRRPSGSPPRRRAEGEKVVVFWRMQSVLGRGQRDDVGERDARLRRRRPRPRRRASSSIRSWRSRWTPRRRSRPPPRGVDPRTRPRDVREDGGGDAGVEAFPTDVASRLRRRTGPHPGSATTRFHPRSSRRWRTAAPRTWTCSVSRGRGGFHRARRG